jgi:diguanylate cyclase (GGDEF)-like protein
MLTTDTPADKPRLRATAQAPWTGRLIAVMVVALLSYGIDIVLDPFPRPVSKLFETFATPLMFLAAAGLCAARGRASREERSAWALFSLALAMFGFGELYYLLVLADQVEIPVPSVADGLWLAFYPLAYAGVYKLLRNRTHGFGKAVWLDALMGGLTVAGATAALVFGVILASLDETATVAATATNLAYPLGDLGLIGLAIVGIAVTGWKASGAWRWIAVAFVLFAVADTTWLVQIAHDSYTERGVINLVWPLAALLIAVAAWRPETRPASGTRRADGRIVLPALFGFAALALVVIDHIVPTNAVAATLALTAIFVMLVRLYLTVREHARMLVQSRVEASTDALTGLGNRRLLEADLAARLDDLDFEYPLMVTLFDLDGFKQYNDSFGHPAGDQLLERLGGRLAALMVGHGTAYRMGGDEFCALWNLSRVDQASVRTLEAAEALSQEGEAFSIRCSYGSVLMPTETTDPAQALALADRRMYARKGDRTSAGRQSSDVLLRALAERDSDLSVHLHGVADLARATAIRLGVPEGELEGVRQTSLLHDVGKVAIPDAILLKPGPLDESEWAFMKQHTIVGERIIAAAPALADVARYVRSTHEHYDGCGYPDGLAGEEIPLPARIVAVCDAYHAMTSDRAYRDARPTSSAIAELRECAGTQFDPRVVEAVASAQRAAGNGRLPVVA